MESISIPAHFDGEKILLDEPFQLKPNAKLLITVLPDINSEHTDWLNLSHQGLADAYDINEPEYSIDSIKEFNPDYEGR